MPLEKFICPDLGVISYKKCLEQNGCRMGERCATRSYLQLVANERPLRFNCPECKNQAVETGLFKEFPTCPKCGEKMVYQPSTTQLIQGTMCAFLKLTQWFNTSPDQRAFMIHGTKSHANLESATDEYSHLEEVFEAGEEGISGIADVIEFEDGSWILADYKTSGSFKVAKALGFVVEEEETGEVYKSGKKKGQPKTRKVLVRKEEAVDMWEWELQFNLYRIKAQRKFKKKIDKLKCMCVCRDGNTFIARSRGVFRNVYYFNVKILDDDFVLDYFNRKKQALFKALQEGFWKNPCEAKENWDGIKCQRFCEVAEYCPYGKYLKQNKETEDMAIKGLSEARRLPRLGKIRLGKKEKTKAGVEYPKEVDYFILDPQTPSKEENQKILDIFHRKYGEEPKQIPIMFPIGDPDVIFSQFYKRYGSSTSLKCQGNGEEAKCMHKDFADGLKVIGEDGGLPVVKCEGKECKFQKGKRECSKVATLQVLLPELPGAGVWQITTGSINSIINVNSCLAHIVAMAGRFHMIPLILERREIETAHDGKKRKHYVLQIDMKISLANLQKLAQLDPTKVALELPAPEAEKEDIYFNENQTVNVETGEIKDAPKKEETPKNPDDEIHKTLNLKIEQLRSQLKDEDRFYKALGNYGVTTLDELDIKQKSALMNKIAKAVKEKEREKSKEQASLNI